MRKNKVVWIVLFAVLCTAIVTFSVTYFVMKVFAGPRRATVVNKGEISYQDKLKEIQNTVDAYFIGEIDNELMGDSLAEGMIKGLGDEWSYYLSKEEYASYLESMKNAYVGIGVTITTEGVEKGVLITDVTPDGPAYHAGLLKGDLIIAVDGAPIRDGSEGCLDMTETKNRVRGEEGTKLTLTVQRDGVTKDYELTRASIKAVNVSSKWMDGNVYYIHISNFQEDAGEDTIAAIQEGINGGCTGFIFDVRYNPGGYKKELVEVLDYILPEGPLFRSVDYNGKEYVDQSDKAHIEIPMAVLVNYDSYSAAEFFAAALQEYQYATIVGEQTYGKGYFQNCYQLSDGSAINISTGKYTTPNGISLVGKGVTPDRKVDLTDEQKAKLYYHQLEESDDLQLQEAMKVLYPAYAPSAASHSGDPVEVVPDPASVDSGHSYADKLSEIEKFVEKYYIGEIDEKKLADSLAEGYIDGLGDEWSYYIPEESYASYIENVTNSYVGIGVTITIEGVDKGLLITDVTPESPAYYAGLMIGDVMVAVEGNPIRNGEKDSLDLTQTKNLVRGVEGTDVTITILRDGETKDYTITRATIKVVNVTHEMLDNNIGYIHIRNFEENTAVDAISAIEDVMDQGAKGIVFDVRFNPGGYKRELVSLLDYILPEGPLFRSKDYDGTERVDYSDADHIEIPMAVLVNYDSYSASEFFAAALQEYGYAVIVGEQTYGKGRFQTSFQLSDGSAINLSIGEYTTPNGVSLVGEGITPDYIVELSDEQRMDLYYNRLDREDDLQFQKAFSVLNP